MSAGTLQREVIFKNHPTDTILGTRTVKVGDSFYIAEDDADGLKSRRRDPAH